MGRGAGGLFCSRSAKLTSSQAGPAHQGVCLATWLATYPAIWIIIYLSGYLAVCLSGNLAVCLSGYLAVCSSGYLAIYSSGYLAIAGSRAHLLAPAPQVRGAAGVDVDGVPAVLPRPRAALRPTRVARADFPWRFLMDCQ